jgi:hypothetical protein
MRKLIYRAKGRTRKELRRKTKDNAEAVESWYKPGQTWRQG